MNKTNIKSSHFSENSTLNTQSTFLDFLTSEAQIQAKLQQNRILPAYLDHITAWIGTHFWQFLLVSSLIMAIIYEAFRLTLYYANIW